MILHFSLQLFYLKILPVYAAVNIHFRQSNHGEIKRAWYAAEASQKVMIQLGIYHTQIVSSNHAIVARSSQWLDIARY